MKSKIIKIYLSCVLIPIILLLGFVGCSSGIEDLPIQTTSSAIQAIEAPDITVKPDEAETYETAKKLEAVETPDNKVRVEKGRRYSSKDEVGEYIHVYNELPPNYVTKKEAQKLGWDNSKGNLWKVTDKMSIGGDVFGNREGSLPKKGGRKYYECDINYKGGFRGSERIVYSNDGLIFYTGDHYETFKKLYGEKK